MNLAVSTILLFLLITPGLAFKLSYFSTRYARKTVFLPLTEEILSAIIPAFLLHVFGFCSLHTLSWVLSVAEFAWPVFSKVSIAIKPNLEIIADLENSLSLVHEPLLIWPRFGWQILLFSTYLGILSYVGTVAAFIAKSYVANHPQLSEHPFLGPYSDWLEALPLELYRGNTLAPEAFDFIRLDLLVELGNECYIYSGSLAEFYLKRDGSLDRIILVGTRRRIVEADPHLLTKWLQKISMDSRFYDIPGYYCIIDYRTVLNINVTYMKY